MDQTASLLRDDDLAHASPSHSLDLSDNDDNDPYPHAYDQEKSNSTAAHRIIQQRQYRAIAISLLTLLTCFTIGSIISTLSMNVSGPAESPTSTSMGECGRTPEQCAKNGCIFDLMMSGWVHPPCYDEELSNQFLRENNFAFFHDRAGTQPLSEAEARLGLYRTIYTNGTFHYQHCTYLWAKQLRARLKKPYVLDSDSRSVEHVQHCLHRVGAPNATQVVLQTGTTLHAGRWQLDCIIGEREVHTRH